jgi:bile acid:Na+ symporter, BASS family
VLRRGLTRTTGLLLPLAVAAAVLGLAAPWETLAERSDYVLAALVLFAALGIEPSQLASLRERKLALAALVAVPFVLLAPLGWVLSRPFDGAVSDGVLALGVSSTEVAVVGLVALAGGSAVVALGALTGSLVLSALAGPPVLGVLAGSGADVEVGELVGRFALVVLVPLAAGLAIRGRFPRLRSSDDELAGLGALTVVVLVYAAMSGADGSGELLSATLAAGLFLVLSVVPVALWAALAPVDLRSTGTFVIGLRDFAVAAVLAGQAFGPAAAGVAGVYGVLMLLVGAAAVLTPAAGRPGRSPRRTA